MFKVYFTAEHGEARSCDEETLTGALKSAECLRNDPRNSYVAIVSENPNSVGRAGCDSVEAGKLPNGNDYGWKKRRD
jgi:hypothetical protein